MSAASKIAALAMFTSAAIAATPAWTQDYGPYGYGAGGMDWDGFYAGVYGGGVPFGDTSWNAGVFAGVNVDLGSAVVGLETQIGADFDTNTSMDALLLGKGGVNLNGMLVYGTGGVGWVSGNTGYALGGGVEHGLTDYLSVRGEALFTGNWSGGGSDLRLTAGLALHL